MRSLKSYRSKIIRLRRRLRDMFGLWMHAFSFIIVLTILVIVGFALIQKVQQEHLSIRDEASEITQIKKTANLDRQIALYKKLIERIGANQAQEEFLHSGLPFDGQMHLLNHTVGDWLYEEYGTSGLFHCKDYFLSSCYHGFILHAVADKGTDVLKEVMHECWEKGEYVAVQCSHAIGHGMLVQQGYANLIDALKTCDKIASESKSFPLYYCHNGVFMENVWAVHESGKPSKDRWVKDDDDMYPCNDWRIDATYIRACWAEQPSLLYRRFEGGVEKVANVCFGLADKEYQKTCFDSLARQIQPVIKGDVEGTFTMCDRMPKAWVDPCVITIASGGFSVGDRERPFIICSRIGESGKKDCFYRLAGNIRFMIQDKSHRKALCAKIPQAFRGPCEVRDVSED